MRTISAKFGKRSPYYRIVPLLMLAGIATTGAACTDFNTTRTIPQRGTVGEDLYGILCDRVSAQALREDMNGSSFAAVCHKAADGTWANDVDMSKLPPLDGTLKDVNGNVVPLEKQQASRNYALARIHAMIRRRDSLIAAFDASFPDIRIKVVDEKNSDPAQTCTPLDDAAAGDRGKLTQQLSDMLGKLQALYNDGTIPHTTEAVAKLMDDINAAEDTRAGLARFEARRGYKPFAVEQGALRPIVAYPNLRDFSNASLRLLSADSDPYSLNATYDGNGKRIPVPGPAHAQFSKMLEVSHEELRTFAPDPWQPTPVGTNDAAGRNILPRPRTTLEVVDFLMRMTDPSFAATDAPLYLTQRDSRGYAALNAAPGVIPPPFTDPQKTGLPALDNLGQFITSNGQLAPSPFPAPNGGAAIARDAAGRALVAANGAPVYTTVDTSQTFANALIRNLPPLINPDTKANHETLMNAIAGLEVLSGTRDGSYATSRQYAPDPTKVDDWKLTNPDTDPPANLGTQPVTVKYDMYHRDTAALLDLIWAAGSVAGDPSGDDVLALVQQLMQQKLPTVARLVGSGLQLKAIADKYPNAHIPPTSTLWDEILDQLVEIEKEPQIINGKSLLQDLLEALANDQVAQLGPVFANQMKYSDLLSYDPKNLNASPYPLPGNQPANLLDKSLNKPNGVVAAPQVLVDRSKPDSGDNRSMFQRFTQLVADAHGVALCNKPGAIVHAKGTSLGDEDLPQISLFGIPLASGPAIVECSFQKVDDLSTFFLDSIVHKAQLYIRYDLARDGIVILGNHLSPATAGILQNSAGIFGFWADRTNPYSPDAVDSGCTYGASTPCPFIPMPNFLTRLQFWNHGDTANPQTDKFVTDLLPQHVATAICPERAVLPDEPCAPGNNNGCTACEDKYSADFCKGAEKRSPDGKVHNLRTCQDGDWLDQRDGNTLFLTEQFGFFDKIKPLLVPFAARNREDIFIKLMEAFNRHWQDDKGTPNECSSDPKNNHYCSRDGASSYEPILIEQFMTDVLPMLHDTIKVLMDPSFTVPHCTGLAADKTKCAASANWTGMQVLLAGTRVLLDPTISANRKVTNRDGSVQGRRNDGTPNPQVTPMYLILQALDNFDSAFAQWTAKHPNDNRLGLWRSARSQLVDQFLAINGTGTNSTFANPITAPLIPKLIQLFRDQLLAHCPSNFVETDPNAQNVAMCEWARHDMATKLGDVTSGPLYGSLLDVTSAIRQDAAGRSELEKLLLYLTDPNSPNEARKTLLTSMVDFPQLLADDSLTPLIHTMSDAASASLVDVNGKVVRTGVVDAVTALLARLAGRAYTQDGAENCGRELDPNQVLTLALQKLVTPMKQAAGDTSPPQTPLEVIIDAIADVNRANPDDSSKLAAPDYANMTLNTSQFLLDKERGLEQFYAIIRLGTSGQPN